MPKGSAGPAPGQAVLSEAALAHLARFATTRTGLVRVLDRRVDRWARAALAEDAAQAEAVASAAAAARVLARAVVERLAQSGAVDDARFAEIRGRRLVQSGRSRRAVSAHLAARGVDAATAHAALPADADVELAAALVFARRRRIGPFRAEPGGDILIRELAAMARAGFAQATARQALAMDAAQAEALVAVLRRL